MLEGLGIWLSVAAQVTALVSLRLVYKQVRANTGSTQGHLINDLEKEFTSYATTFAKLKDGGDWRSSVELCQPEISELENIASFCEKLKHFLDLGIIEWRMLDRWFRNRFFIVIDNPNVWEYAIGPYESDWAALKELESQWRERLPVSDPRRSPTPRRNGAPAARADS